MGSDAQASDPEADRVDELLQRAVRGRVTEAETEELSLYSTQRPELRKRITDAARQGELGQGWLERVYRDEALQKVETSARTKIERFSGLGLVALAFVLSFANPIIAGAVLAAGAALLLYSFVRVRIATHLNDPYKDIQR
jgi:hypothetical protein